MLLNNPIDNIREDRDIINNELRDFLETLPHRLETVGLGNCTGLIEDVLRESAGEIPFYYTQQQVEAMALCSFILKLPPEERRDLERLEKLFDERQMTGAIRLLFGDLPPAAVSRQEARETVLTFLSTNSLGLTNLWHDSRLAAYYLLQGNPKTTGAQILNGVSEVAVLPRGIGVITPKSACKELLVCPLAGSTGIILILNYEGGAKAVIGGHFDSLDLVIADPEASDELRKSCSRVRSGMSNQRWDFWTGTLRCEDIIAVLRALRSAGFDGPLTSVRIHIASPKIASDITAARRICTALLELDPLRHASDKSITQTLYEFSTFSSGSISVSIPKGIRLM